MSFMAYAPAMAIPRDPTHAEIARFLTTRSGDQMARLVQAIREPAAQAALTASLLLLPPPPVVAARDATPEKTKKALNAFVGFRCYYISIPMFKPWPMKKLSNPMGIIWEADPNKSLWSLMTKAWSIIRDQIGKDNAPLDQFFGIICPYLNIPSPNTYLETHGWMLTVDEEGDPALSRHQDFEPAAIDFGITEMALSVEDIINYCQAMGYAQAYITDTSTTSTTFLGHSNGKSNTAYVSERISPSVHEARVVARNKRRAKRQNTKNTDSASSIKEQIAMAHAIGDVHKDQTEDASALADGQIPFYTDLAALLSDHMANANFTNDIAPASTMFDQPLPIPIDWNAFRLGADEDVTLPSFGSPRL